jgi:tetratricopeptide (TPR) repeat protein
MNNRRLILVAGVALFTVCSYGQSGKKYFKAGNEFVKSMKYEDAVAQFTSAIGCEPSNAGYYYARGKTYESLLKYNEAKADFEKALVFNPKNDDIHVKLGAVCNDMGQYEEALVHLNHASAINKRNSTLYPEKVITLIGLKKFDQALGASDTAIIIMKKAPINYYWRGQIYTDLNNDFMAKQEYEKAISKDKKLVEPRLALADLLLKTNDTQGAMDQCNEILKNDDRNTAAYAMRSKVYIKNFDYPSAINDLSKNILIAPDNPQFYLDRGYCYKQFNQHSYAINDFSKYISLNPNTPLAYSARAKSYEEIMNYDKAMDDYKKITVLAEFDQEARKALKEAQDRLYELNKESDPPEITVISPVAVNDSVQIRGDSQSLLISGKIKDKSKIKSLTINNEPITIAEKNGIYDFLSNINISGKDKIVLTTHDDYDNEKTITYPIKRTEITPPTISIIAPYTENGLVFLDSPTPNIAIQGKITDNSRIKSITVSNITASYDPTEMNPAFSAFVDVSNLNKFTVVAEDIYGNRQENEYILNREGALISASNPMGKTWVVFIENSSYENFAALEGPIKDVSTIRRALANYQINNIIHEKDMTKQQMEYFFNIDLRDKVRKNQVKSLLIWYAGHGKFINNVGYWIPVDAKREDEFSYFSVNNLKAGLQGYGDVVVHTLVVSDACESGPGFYTAMRAVTEAPTCDNTQVAGSKSAQVFTSAGGDLAVDNSKFTATFANTLMNNKNACIPIESVVRKVTAAVASDRGQKPEFGKIQGLEDMNGTFFFIAK